MTTFVDSWRQKAHEASVRHHKAIVAAAVVLLAGTGVTAFGLAPLVPEGPALQQTLLVEAVRPEGVEQQLEALAAVQLPLRRSTISRAADSPESLFSRLGIADSAAATFIRRDPVARRILLGRGKMIQAVVSPTGTLQQLVARFAPERNEQLASQFVRLTVDRVGSSWIARAETVPLVAQTRLGSGTIRSTLFAATDEAGLPDSVATQVAEIFATEIDFHRELRKGDTFSVVYEALTADGEPINWNEGAGRVLAAEFVNQGKAHQAVWFNDGRQAGSYFGFDGRSKRRAFLASPMEFSRITSGFAMRFHPIMQSWRAHLGVDYGAPMGTAVRSVGDGAVEFAGWQNGYGNVVIVQHGGERSTLYAHLSRIDVKKGDRVEQGQHLGAVGTTGWSTGPHLHFEFRVRGQHQDPLSIAKDAESAVLDAAAREQLSRVTRSVQAKLELADSLLGVRSSAE